MGLTPYVGFTAVEGCLGRREDGITPLQLALRGAGAGTAESAEPLTA